MILDHPFHKMVKTLEAILKELKALRKELKK
jgi:hypothetical protein